MSTLRVRFKLNPGRTGVAFGKLSKQTENIELFLRSLASDLGQSDGPNLWLAKDFREGSLVETAEFQAVVTPEVQENFDEAVKVLSKYYGTNKKVAPPSYVRPATVARFGALAHALDADEKIGIAVFDSNGKQKPWVLVDKLQLERIAKSIEPEVQYVGAVMGATYEWNKGAKPPYIIIREINTNELVKCSYARADYAKVAALFKDENAVVTVQGLTTYNRISGKSEITMAHAFDVAPNFSTEDFESFFGADPNFTGELSTEEFIRRARDNDE